MKKFTSPHGQEIAPGQSFELDGVAYPWNWLDLASAADLNAKGITVETVADPAPVQKTIDESLASIGLSLAELHDALNIPGNGKP
jgi:hypothetical protein